MLFGLGPARGRLPLGTIEVHTGGSSPGRSRVKLHLGLRAVPLAVGAPKIQRPPRRGWFHVAFRARAPGFSIGLLAYGECQGFPVLIPHKVS